jgi:hypothetical protein
LFLVLCHVSRIAVSKAPGEWRVAVCDGDTLLDFSVWRPGAPDGFGDVFAGRVSAHVPAMAGYFVALPDGHGFLPESAARLSEGDPVIVRVARAAQGGKGPRLALVEGAARPDSAPAKLREGQSALHRLVAGYPGATVEVDSLSALPFLREVFGARARHVETCFDEIEDQVETLAEPWADLPGGMRAGFFPTPGLTAIDLDGGSITGFRARKDEVQFAANRDALPALARQIRLRNLSGVILVDLAGLAPKRRRALGPALEAALAADPVGARLLGFSPSGLVEISRARTTPPLHELLESPLGMGLAKLRRLDRLMRKARGRPVLRALPTVLAALRSDAFALPEFVSEHGVAPVLQEARCDPIPDCAVE